MFYQWSYVFLALTHPSIWWYMCIESAGVWSWNELCWLDVTIGTGRVSVSPALMWSKTFSDQWHEPLLCVFYLFLALLFQVHLGHCSLYFDGLGQERHNSIANALELCIFCGNPSICSSVCHVSPVKWSVTCKHVIVCQNWDDIDPMPPVLFCHGLFVDVNMCMSCVMWISLSYIYGLVQDCGITSALAVLHSVIDVIVFVLIVMCFLFLSCFVFLCVMCIFIIPCLSYLYVLCNHPILTTDMRKWAADEVVLVFNMFCVHRSSRRSRHWAL